jgi:hypothetical protein
MNNELERLETLIDEALASYTPQDARHGLEQRILAAVSRSPQRQWSWKPIWALVAAATLMAAIAFPMWFKSARPEVAVVHPSIVTGKQHSSVAAPAPAKLMQQTHTTHAQTAAAESVARETVTRPATDSIAPVVIASINNQPLTDKAIEMKAISIARIHINTLN